MLRILWVICIVATLWFALVPTSMGGLGGAGYHGAAFLVLGALTPLAFPRLHLLVVWGGLILLGGGIELAQHYLEAERFGEWEDFWINAYASSFAVNVVFLARSVIAYRVGKKRAGE